MSSLWPAPADPQSDYVAASSAPLGIQLWVLQAKCSGLWCPSHSLTPCLQCREFLTWHSYPEPLPFLLHLPQDLCSPQNSHTIPGPTYALGPPSAGLFKAQGLQQCQHRGHPAESGRRCFSSPPGEVCLEGSGLSSGQERPCLMCPHRTSSSAGG